MKSIKKRILSVFTAAALAVGSLCLSDIGVLPNLVVPASADTSWSKFTAGVTTYGTSGIGAPKASGTNTNGWAGDYVYYGQYNSNPVKYRVLDPNTSVFGGTTMLLDCDSILEKVRFDNDGVANEGATKVSEWAFSDLKAWLNTTNTLEIESGVNKAGFLNSFTSSENTAIATSTKASPATGTKADGSGWSYFYDYAGLSNDRIFVLDAKEATNTSYGYADTENDDKTRKKSDRSQ